MNRSNMLPRTFAILRINAYRGPQMQILRSEYRRQQDVYTIENLENPVYNHPTANYRITSLPRHSVDETIYTIRFRNQETNAIMDVKYWYVPFVIRNLGLPFLEFQYRSWIPRPTCELSFVSDIHLNEVLRVIERIQEQRLAMIRSMEDEEVPSRPLFPHWHPLDAPGLDDYDDRQTMVGAFVGVNRYRSRRPSTPPPQPEVRIVQVEVPVERIIVQTQVKPLPKSVGDILLANARGTPDTCPIAALPFKDCSKLSITSCFHVFDYASLSRWQEDHATCPVCRAKIENVVSE